MRPVLSALRKARVPRVRTTELCQGMTLRWVVAWSFAAEASELAPGGERREGGREARLKTFSVATVGEAEVRARVLAFLDTCPAQEARATAGETAAAEAAEAAEVAEVAEAVEAAASSGAHDAADAADAAEGAAEAMAESVESVEYAEQLYEEAIDVAPDLEAPREARSAPDRCQQHNCEPGAPCPDHNASTQRRMATTTAHRHINHMAQRTQCS